MSGQWPMQNLGVNMWSPDGLISLLYQELQDLKLKLQEQDLKIFHQGQRIDLIEQNMSQKSESTWNVLANAIGNVNNTRPAVIVGSNNVPAYQDPKTIEYSSNFQSLNQQQQVQNHCHQETSAAQQPVLQQTCSPSSTFSGLEILGAGQAGSVIISEEEQKSNTSGSASSYVAAAAAGVGAFALHPGVESPSGDADPNAHRKKVNRIHASLPAENTTNPIAALINFCKHQLRFDLDFKSNEDSNGIHTVKILFPGEEPAAEARDRKKKIAKENAAKLVLARLNKEEDLLERQTPTHIERKSTEFMHLFLQRIRPIQSQH
eukprot:TRINITY_DN5245_c0_g1_i2.p1 TRINITY_DN5245_c0_g1~~TRINITY_DN5245_c0_g1_i2.p1  ORF type:complete len:319 (-),score=55.77 TRINITY_DN5245_c0_g1_i2:1497-2453(-)